MRSLPTYSTARPLAEIGAREGLTRSGCVRISLERFIVAEQAGDPYALLERVRAFYEVAGGMVIVAMDNADLRVATGCEPASAMSEGSGQRTKSDIAMPR